MKQIVYGAAILLFAGALTACGQKKTEEAVQNPVEIGKAILDSQENLPEFYLLEAADEEFAFYLTSYYLLDSSQVDDGVIYYADGAEASEIAVLEFQEETAAKAAKSVLETYIKDRSSVFAGYAPQQAALAESGIVDVSGRYAAMMICADTDAAQAAFRSCFGESGTKLLSSEAAAVPVSFAVSAGKTADTKDVYDPAAILAAWQSGDRSLLSEKNRKILEAAEDVIDEVTDSSMSDYEKELAIHDWMTGWGQFDFSVFSHGSGSQEKSDNDNPYGFLINRTGMCHGYSSTFQLFMDLLDIECITVFGTPGSNGVEHSWSMVRLDEEWYCVDVAWDDPIGGSPQHRYFNVTSQYLRNSGIHHWDESSVPEAAADTYSKKLP